MLAWTPPTVNPRDLDASNAKFGEWPYDGGAEASLDAAEEVVKCKDSEGGINIRKHGGHMAPALNVYA